MYREATCTLHVVCFTDGTLPSTGSGGLSHEICRLPVKLTSPDKEIIVTDVRDHISG